METECIIERGRKGKRNRRKERDKGKSYNKNLELTKSDIKIWVFNIIIDQ